MLIGELARRTGVSERLIRYYEDQGLLESRRRANGYREYGDDAELTVARIRAFLAAGLPTRSIARLLPCAAGVDALRPCPGTLELLHERLEELDRRAAEIAEARTLLTRTITRTKATPSNEAN
ncbi:MAG TPA: MerR family transcriptional regulator [Spirillospora sp.]|nr:MerR family transcriptional regulator [Spirillospora sp.]